MKKISKTIVMDYMKKRNPNDVDYTFRQNAILMFLSYMNDTMKVFPDTHVVVKDDKYFKEINKIPRYEMYEVVE